MEDTHAFLIHYDGIEVEVTPHHIFVDLWSLTAGFIDTLKFLTKPVESDISTTNADKLTVVVVDGLYKCGIMAADVGAIVVIIGIRPESLFFILGADIPGRLGVIVGLTTYERGLIRVIANMVDVRFEPMALRLEIIRLEGGKITKHVRI
jgi:hypothetical protein